MAGQTKSPKSVRTTVMLDRPLKENLECLSKTEGQTQGRIIREALGKYMQGKGLQPDKRPKLVIAY